MKREMAKKLLGMAVMGLVFPLSVYAAEGDLQLKIDQLSKEVADLKGSVKKVEDKSLGRWLTIGGDYRFRVDSLHGQTAAYSDAIGTMMNLVGGFTGPSGVAGTSIGGSISPSATQFIMQGKAGSLFTPAQFNTILTQYMPQAMAASLPGLFTTMNTPGFNPSAVPALTVQQQSILNTLSTKVMPTVMAMQVGSIPGMAAILPPGTPGTTTVGQVFAGFPAASQQLATTLLMQGFLGAGSGNLALVPAYKPKNETVYTNRVGLDLHAKATQDVTVNVKLDMYKAFGSQSDQTTADGYFADRVGVFDGTIGHVPSTSLLNVDRAYATWSNIAEQPVWFSVGRRPSSNGAPTNLRLNNERPGNGGTPALLVDYAFDGMTIGYAPDIDMLPGAYAKVCYGRGFDSGLKKTSNSIKDTDMLGVAIIPIDTDPLRVWLQWNRGWNIFDFPAMNNTIFGNTAPAANLGSMDWYGIGAMSTLKDIGPGKLNFFTDLGMSVSHPSPQVSNNAGFQGLMTGGFFNQDFAPQDKTGWAVYAGVRYDLPSKTKLGFEFNHGSENWQPFSPAADDMWTSKVGTRGNVYEPYIIQELDLKPISSYLSKTFFKIGYQYYDFQYTGSNNWVGAPVKISSIQPTDLFLMAPVKSAHDVYATFEVKF